MHTGQILPYTILVWHPAVMGYRFLKLKQKKMRADAGAGLGGESASLIRK